MKSVFRFLVLLAAVLLFVQTVSVAHEAKHGECEHEHEGMLCGLVHISALEVVLENEEWLAFLQPNTSILLGISVFEDVSWFWPHERAPLPRGPPLQTVMFF